MDSIPLNILVKIFSLVDNSSTHLLSKNFRIISILTMSKNECRKRLKFNFFNISFLTFLSQNDNAHKRNIKFDKNKKKWKLFSSCFEIIFKTQHKTSYSYFEDILSRCFIPEKLYDKLLEISVLYNRKDIAELLLSSKKIYDVNDPFITAYDHKYYDIVELLYEYKNQDNVFGVFSVFDYEQRKEFKRIFFTSEYVYSSFEIFVTLPGYERILHYYANSQGIQKNITVTHGLINNKQALQYMGLIRDTLNPYIHTPLDNLWNKKKIKNFVSYWPRIYYSQQSQIMMIIYNAFIEEEMDLFEYLINNCGIENCCYLIRNQVLNNKKSYIKLIEDERFRNYSQLFKNSNPVLFYEHMIFDSYILKKDITHLISDLIPYFDKIIQRISVESDNLVLREIGEYINSLKSKSDALNTNNNYYK